MSYRKRKKEELKKAIQKDTKSIVEMAIKLDSE